MQLSEILYQVGNHRFLDLVWVIGIEQRHVCLDHAVSAFVEYWGFWQRVQRHYSATMLTVH